MEQILPVTSLPTYSYSFSVHILMISLNFNSLLLPPPHQKIALSMCNLADRALETMTADLMEYNMFLWSTGLLNPSLSFTGFTL